MITPQLLDYIRQQIQQGVDKEQIKKLLTDNSWQASDVDEAFSLVSDSVSPLVSPLAGDAARQSLEFSAASSQNEPSLFLGATALLKQAWNLYKQRLGVFLGITVIPVLFWFVAGFLLVMAFPPGMASADIEVSLSRLIISIAAFFLIVIIGVIVSAWGQTALLYAIKESGESIGIKEAYRRGWRKIVPYYWISFLTSFIVIGGMALFVIPGIIFFVWFSLAIFVLIAEDLRGMNALLKSKEYVKGRWGGVLWRLLFISGLAVIALIPILIAKFTFPFLSGVINIIMVLFLTPLIIAYEFLLYNNLKVIKGDIVFAPTKGKKAVFISVGVIGILVIPVMILLLIATNPGVVYKPNILDARRQADIRQIQLGLELYYDEHGIYPSSLNELYPEYLPGILVDPKTYFLYQYQRQGDFDYQVCVQLETKEQECVSN